MFKGFNHNCIQRRLKRLCNIRLFWLVARIDLPPRCLSLGWYCICNSEYSTNLVDYILICKCQLKFSIILFSGGQQGYSWPRDILQLSYGQWNSLFLLKSLLVSHLPEVFSYPHWRCILPRFS